MFPFDFFTHWSPAQARERMRRGQPPRRMRVAGLLDLVRCDWLKELPSGLEAGAIDAAECRQLRSVGAIRANELRLRRCTSLERLAEGLAVRHLDVAGCVRLTRIPSSTAASLWNLDVSGCTELTALPNGLAHLQTLNLGGCANLRSLPDDIRVQSWIEVADSGLKTLPYSLRSVQVMWRRMPVPDRIAFTPETITADEVLRERNLEFRRVLIERMGVERFISSSQAVTLDNDQDTGGPRRLLCVPLKNDEDIVCLEVHCPSTGRKYFLRVPPETQTCAGAAAWVAGFNSARLYRPVVET